ncbi:distal tail fiber assembly catalyst protein [Serratia phage SP1]|nr:distal tail fiber assembly catalyst protein [Serratia phage SP1]
MAGVVPNAPFWASDVRNVTGTGNMWDAGVWLLKRQPPFWMSELAGKGEIHLYYGSNHAFNKDTLINDMGNAVAWNWTGTRIFLHFAANSEICSYSMNVPTLEFPEGLAAVEFVRLEIEGGCKIYGRGADAKPFDDWSGWGAQGGTAIANRIGGKLHINNWGQIFGGGGSGIGEWGDGAARGGGGGGAPLGHGHGSFGEGRPSTDATFTEKGLGARSVGDRVTMGDGGNPGEKGGVGRYAPGDRGGDPGFFYWAGGSGDAYWIRVGDVKGQIQY